ncbi:unnamed protein product [Microthlaspi erraticum]|uniref:Phorbol-ester/DAG-type domain-containing protein n=1 Tax=Microthlaspi erraticum TaxID=1685480 RepID=A0A6D2HQM9_9BRAS|nr:unnamed protein product [Microthlaspi erraticum]
MDDENGPRCPLSHPSHPHTLSHQYAADYCRFGCFTCGVKEIERASEGSQYFCTICDVEFHQTCPKHPRKITHPYHLQHSLTLTYRNPETKIISSSGSESKGSEDVKFEYVEISLFQSDVIFKKCSWCGQDLKGDWFYRCSICAFCLDLTCAETFPPLTIPNPKNHPHSLLFFPRPFSTPCDACGLVNVLEPSYICLLTTSDQDHASLAPSLSHSLPFTGNLTMPVHSKCATHDKVWDGRELEWEPEDSDNEAEDIVPPFRKLGDGFIKHFSHKHRLKLKKHDGVRDTEKQCRACVFPIVSPQFYHCRRCNYSLHEVCAGLPRKLDHALHRHTLLLDTSPLPLKHYASIYCSACSRAFTGFRYICSKESCKYSFKLDVRCISVSECFVHKSHELYDHPLFISTSSSSKAEILCKGCKKTCSWPRLQCMVCEFALCYPCGTIPNELHYKYDKHPLTLCYGETTKEEDIYWWCEVCEKQLDPTKWFYTCNECCTTVHLQCVFGSSAFMKPRSVFSHWNGVVRVFRNGSNTRQVCYKCNKLCTDSIYYEGYKWGKTEGFYNNIWTFRLVFCSLHCMEMKKW